MEEPFTGLTVDEKLVALYVLSGPYTNAIGLYRLSPALMAEDLRMTVLTARRRFAAVCRVLQYRYDVSTRVVWLPAWAEENPPQNPNIVRAWRSAFDELPDSALKAEAGAFLHAFLVSKGEPFAKSFGEPVSNHLPNAPVPVPESGMVRPITDRSMRCQVNAKQTREAVNRFQARKHAALTAPRAADAH